MPRRRPPRTVAPAEKPDEESAQEDQESELSDPQVDSDMELEMEAEHAARGGAAAGSRAAESGHRSLRFDEELSWKPAKPIPTATLLSRLEKLSKELSEMEQEETDLDSLREVATKLAHRNLMQHKDRGVKAYVACCLVDMLELFAPEAPFTSDQLKMMFTLFVKDILPGLHDPSNPYNSQNKYVLMSLTNVKSVLLITELHGADDLLLRLFNSTFDGVSASAKGSSEEQLAKDVEIHLTDMLVHLIDESEGSVPAAVIDSILSQFLRAAPPSGGRPKEHNGNQSTLLLKSEPPAYVMAKTISNRCADRMSRFVSQYFSDVILNASGFATKSNGHRQGDESDDEEAVSGPSDADLKSLQQAHLLIRELWRAAPTILQNVVPQLEAELGADNVHLRQIATETFGDMISGIGAAGPPPPPSLDPAAYPLLRLQDEPVLTSETNVLRKPYSPMSFAQSHSGTYRNFVGRRNDKAATIRAAWVTAAGHIVSTSAGGIGLSREEEHELILGIRDKLNDSEEKVRLAAVKAIELFDFRDIVTKLGVLGGVQKDDSIFASLADRCRDRKAAVRVDAMVLLGKLWAVGSGEIAEGQDGVVNCLSGVPSRIINAFYANDSDLNILLDRVVFECLVPLKYPMLKGKGKSSQGKTAASQADQDSIRAERILLMLKSLDANAQKAFFAMQARQPQFAKALGIFVQQCEAYNGGIIDANEEKVKASLSKTFQWVGAFFPDALKVRNDLQRFAKLNDRRSYQLIKYAIESESDFKTVRRAINELILKIQASSASSCLDTLIPLVYRSSCLIFNRSHLATIMDYSKSDKGGLASVAHQVLNDISQRNPDLFKAHSEELRKAIIDQAPTASKTNDPTVCDILKAYSSYAKKYASDVKHDKPFTQALVKYALQGTPPKAAKYAVNIIMSDAAKGKVNATNLLQSAVKDLDFESPNFLNKLAAISQLERLAPMVTVDAGDTINDVAIKQVLRQVRTETKKDKDPVWVNDADLDDEIQAKCLCLRILVNQALANQEEGDALEKVKSVFKLLRTIVVAEGEFCKVKDTPLCHKKRLRLLAGQLILKLCTVKKYDDQLEPTSFNKLAEIIQDSDDHVRRRFSEKVQNYLTRGKLRPRFYTMLFLAAFEPIPDMKNRVETWLRSRARYYESKQQHILESIMGRLIPLLAHHPDYTSDAADLLDFSTYLLFYLSTVATMDNISLIYKYAERVKQTRDGVDPAKSENLYYLSDLAQTVVRKYQENKGWSFQAWPDKVGLPTGLYSVLPSSEVAQQIAKKQYLPEELDAQLDNRIRQLEKKKKRKSVHEWAEPAAKKPKTQMKAVIRQKPDSKPKAAKPKKTPKAKTSRARKSTSPDIPLSERRRSGRSQKITYTERADNEDEAEMLDGVAEWTYEGDKADKANKGAHDSDSSLTEESEAEEEAGGDEDEEAADKEEEEEDEPPPRSSRKGKGKAPARTSKARGGRAARGSSDLDMEDDE